MSRVIIPETACLATPAAEYRRPRRRHGSQWRQGHSNSLSPQTPGTHRSPVGARAPRGHQGHRLPIPNEPQGPRVLAKAAPPGPLSLGLFLPDRQARISPWDQREPFLPLLNLSQTVCCSGPQNSRETRAPVPVSPPQHNVTWDLTSTAITLDPRDRFPGGGKDCDMFLLLLNPLCYSPSLRE